MPTDTVSDTLITTPSKSSHAYSKHTIENLETELLHPRGSFADFPNDVDFNDVQLYVETDNNVCTPKSAKR